MWLTGHTSLLTNMLILGKLTQSLCEHNINKLFPSRDVLADSELLQGA